MGIKDQGRHGHCSKCWEENKVRKIPAFMELTFFYWRETGNKQVNINLKKNKIQIVFLNNEVNEMGYLLVKV